MASRYWQLKLFLLLTVALSLNAADVATGGKIDCGFKSAELLNATYNSIAVGRDYACAVTDDQSLSCTNPSLISGDGNYTSVAAGGSHVCALTPENLLRCWGGNETGQAGVPEGKYLAVATGLRHTCALTDQGIAKCWGDNAANQTSPPSDLPGNLTAIAAGGSHSCALTSEGDVQCWGSNSTGQVDVPTGNYTVVATGAEHTCVLFASNGTVQCHGKGYMAQVLPRVGLERYAFITAGGNATCAMTLGGNRSRCYWPTPDGNITAFRAKSPGADQAWMTLALGQSEAAETMPGRVCFLAGPAESAAFGGHVAGVAGQEVRYELPQQPEGPEEGTDPEDGTDDGGGDDEIVIDGGGSNALLIGAVAGAAVGALLLGAVIGLLLCRRRRRRRQGLTKITSGNERRKPRGSSDNVKGDAAAAWDKAGKVDMEQAMAGSIAAAAACAPGKPGQQLPAQQGPVAGTLPLSTSPYPVPPHAPAPGGPPATPSHPWQGTGPPAMPSDPWQGTCAPLAPVHPAAGGNAARGVVDAVPPLGQQEAYTAYSRRAGTPPRTGLPHPPTSAADGTAAANASPTSPGGPAASHAWRSREAEDSGALIMPPRRRR